MAMKHILLMTSLFAFVGSAVGESETPILRTVASELQPKIQILNPEYLVYAPSGNTDAKFKALRCAVVLSESFGKY